MKFNPKFFALSEFTCPCCGSVKVAAALVHYLENLRRAWDGPLLVNSGYRCRAHNAEVGGAGSSRHLIGCAADIRPHDLSIFGVLKALVRHTTQGRDGWEVIFYPRFIHIAVPRMEGAKLWAGGSLSIEIS